MAKDGLAIINGLNSEIEFNDDGTWREIPFAGDIEASGGEAPTTEVVTFKRVGTVVGKERLPSLTVQIPSYMPHHSIWQALSAANEDGSPLQFRIRTQEHELADSTTGNTAAIAAAPTGAVTLAPLVVPASGAAHSIDWRAEVYGVGLGLKIGTTVYIVDSISDTGVLTVKPAPESAVAAATYKVVVPRLRMGPFLARITTLAPFSLPVEGQLSTTLGLQPVVRLPRWVID